MGFAHGGSTILAAGRAGRGNGSRSSGNNHVLQHRLHRPDGGASAPPLLVLVGGRDD